MGNSKQIIIHLILGIGLICLNFSVVAQNSIFISTFNLVVLNFTAPFEPGSPIEPVIDNSKWLNYNVTVSPIQIPVSIAVEIASGTIPEGIQLQVQAGSYIGAGGSHPGISMGNLILKNTSQVLISNIGTCNTGVGINVGHQLTYKMSISDYSNVKSSSSTVNILYTIMQ